MSDVSIGFPLSMTATIHVKFHYQDTKTKGVEKGDVEMINHILERASGMSPEERTFLTRFAEHLSNQGKAESRN